jgi:glucose-6-phosphate isomerase
MVFDPALSVSLAPDELRFIFGSDTTGPQTELRKLDAIRASLLDPKCTGPDPVYGIVMDVARPADMPALRQRMLLFGVVAYAAGRLGEEPVRSQGHVHAIAPHSGWSPPEIFEVWEGSAIIYAQRTAEDNPGECVAILARPGDKVVVPPSWAHCVINANPRERMVFAAWCDRQYGFVYDDVRRHHGLAWFPVFDAKNQIEWRANPAYQPSSIQVRCAREYPELNLNSQRSLYQHFLDDPASVQWVSDPAQKATLWRNFQP